MAVLGGIDHMEQFFVGGLKFVRWHHAARNGRELSVRKGDEVTLMKPANNKMWKVSLDGRTGLVPMKCFFRRITVTWSHAPEDDDEVDVSKGDIVGIMDPDVGDRCKIMKEDNTEGLIPKRCFYRRYEVYHDHKMINPDELNVKKGDYVALVDNHSFGSSWKVFLNKKVGLVPSKCFEPPVNIHWDYEARPDTSDLTVKKGDTVTLVDFDSSTENSQKILVRVRLGDKVGTIQRKCFEVPYQVYKEYNGPKLSVEKGNIVGIVEGGEEKEGYLQVRLGHEVGYIPKYCFEIPAKVAKSYTATRETEISVKQGDEIHVMDATAYIKVRVGHAEGEVPLSCINIDVRKILPMLEKKDEEIEMQNRNDDKTLEVAGQFKEKVMEVEDSQPTGIKSNVDETSLSLPRAISDSKTAVEYLKGIPVEKMFSIGFSLGLTFETLRKMSTESFHDELTEAWLLRKDGVTNIGIPTWKSLTDVLQKHNFNKIAETVWKDNTRLVMPKMINLHWIDSNNKQWQLSIVNEGCGKWYDIGLQIGMPNGRLEGLREKHDNVASFTEVLNYWIQTGGTSDYRATWIGLQNVLRDSEQAVLAERIRAAMPCLDL